MIAPRIRAAFVYTTLTIVGFVAAYCPMFNQFRPYDDEGTLLVGLKAYVAGDTLYSDIETFYGPFYYGVFRGFFALTDTGVTTDASRLLVVAIWGITSLLFGLGVHRLTGRLVLGAAAMTVAWAILGLLKSEPMHPVGIALVLLAAFVLVVAAWSGRRPVAWGAAAGGLLAALALTKINLGLFAMAAVALALVTTLEPLRTRVWVRWPVTLAFLAMPLLLMRPNLEQEWVRDYALIFIAGAAAIVVVPPTLQRSRADSELARWSVGALAGCVATAVTVIAVTAATGSSVGDIYESVIVKAQTQADVFTVPLELPDLGNYSAIAALAVAIIATRLMATAPTGGPWPGLLRLGAGAGIWLSASGSLPSAIPTESVGLIGLPLALAWVGAFPPSGADEGPRCRFVRVLLPSLAVAETLQAYPVAGTQVASPPSRSCRWGHSAWWTAGANSPRGQPRGQRSPAAGWGSGSLSSPPRSADPSSTTRLSALGGGTPRCTEASGRSRSLVRPACGCRPPKSRRSRAWCS